MSDMADNEPETRPVHIKGRDIQVKKLRDAQMVMIARDADLLGREDVDTRRKLDAVNSVMTMFESVIVSDEDKKYVIDLTRQGELDIADFMTFLTVFADEAPPKKPVVRRGRPRKAA
jgi:hypothetical protein